MDKMLVCYYIDLNCIKYKPEVVTDFKIVLLRMHHFDGNYMRSGGLDYFLVVL